jgi:hypothetical protein
MLVSRRMLLVALLSLGTSASAQKPWQKPSEDAPARVFGPRWRQLVRDSGMIFSGTVLDIRSRRLGQEKQVPTIKIRFRVDRAILGVRPREPITIFEWAGAWSDHPLHAGQHVLLLLYPRSRLGLTSPVGGSLGQVVLSNENTVAPRACVRDTGHTSQLPDPTESKSRAAIALSQLEQAIRNARNSQSVSPSRSARSPRRSER